MAAADPNQLSVQLWRQREILELLLFKYEEERLLLAAGRTRWMPHALREVDKVVERLQEAALTLSVTLADVAASWGLPADSQLDALVDHAPTELWRELLGEHLSAIVGLIRDVRAARTAALLQARTVSDVVAGAGEARAATYTAAGQVDHTATVAHLIDASL